MRSPMMLIPRANLLPSRCKCNIFHSSNSYQSISSAIVNQRMNLKRRKTMTTTLVQKGIHIFIAYPKFVLI